MVYGAVALFWQYPEVSALSVQPPLLAACLCVMLIALPVLGNLFPERVSFLLAMRFYAGNWAYGVWLFEKSAFEKLERLTKSAALLHKQLERFYDPALARGLIGKVMGWALSAVSFGSFSMHSGRVSAETSTRLPSRSWDSG